MANPAVLQSKGNEGTNPPATNIQFLDTQFNSVTTVVSALLGFHFCSNFAGTHTDPTFTDTQLNSFTKLDQQNGTVGSGGAGQLASFLAVNIPGDSSTPDTMRQGFGTVGESEDFFANYIVEVGNVLASPLVGHSGNTQLALAPGSNNITSGNIVISAGQVPCLLVAVAMDNTGSGSPSAPTAGTGMTQLAQMWGFFSGINNACIATRLITTAGTYAGTFNQVSSASEDIVCCAVILQGSAVASAFPPVPHKEPAGMVPPAILSMRERPQPALHTRREFTRERSLLVPRRSLFLPLHIRNQQHAPCHP